MSETTTIRERPTDVLRELARKLVRMRELTAESLVLGAEVDGLADRLGWLVPGGRRYFHVPTYWNYVHPCEVVCLEREDGPEGAVLASLVPASDPNALEWPEPERGHTVNPDVPCGVAAQVAAVIDDEAA